jgi:hypothetical protein
MKLMLFAAEELLEGYVGGEINELHGRIPLKGGSGKQVVTV